VLPGGTLVAPGAQRVARLDLRPLRGPLTAYEPLQIDPLPLLGGLVRGAREGAELLEQDGDEEREDDCRPVSAIESDTARRKQTHRQRR
jgi:hypothetical protein